MVGGIGSYLYSIWNQIVYAVSNFRIQDILDILIITFVIFKAIEFLRDSRAGQLLKGLGILFGLYLIAGWWDLTTTDWILSRVVDSIIIAAAVIFQPELRRILEKVGRTNFSKGQFFGIDEDILSDCIDDVCHAAATMQEGKIGALIVFERSTQLGEIVNTGTIIDAEASVSMINNVFFPKSPLHDGAMIIRHGRLYAAGCILPLTQREDLSLQLGTRHRAAIGMTENSDAVVLVVSEETGTISIVNNGKITRNYNSVSATAELKNLLLTSEEKENKPTVTSVIKKILPTKKQEERTDEK